ncbi:Zn-ribbon domain-containing OB-fold protein [Blastococcus sp. TF02A-26]|uniref:Zn-ribbon domain-containing OB-fold protein n=1 Tax=Blastococcus sp. TF02A-26 TaxID=2250577 RepID=UPI0018F60DD6|nr:OB-fold domain-containing protein [Blastococcus sp. TF02A-26]
MTSARRPLPVPDALSAPFWEAAARHVLTLSRCSDCGTLTHPPNVACDACGSTDPRFTAAPVDGRGVVRSWTVIRQSFLPGFADLLPYVLVDVELAEQPDVRLVGRLLDGPDAPLKTGSPVRVAFEDLADGVAVPAFTLAEAS